MVHSQVALGTSLSSAALSSGAYCSSIVIILKSPSPRTRHASAPINYFYCIRSLVSHPRTFRHHHRPLPFPPPHPHPSHPNRHDFVHHTMAFIPALPSTPVFSQRSSFLPAISSRPCSTLVRRPARAILVCTAQQVHPVDDVFSIFKTVMPADSDYVSCIPTSTLASNIHSSFPLL